MKSSKVEQFKMGKGIKRVTHMPGFFLRIKGKIDSKKPESAAVSFCEKLFNRCQAIENKETIAAEEILHSVRKQASQILASMNGNQMFLKSIPEAQEELSPIEIRANIRNREAKNNTSLELNNQLKAICEINEVIVNINSTLEQRVEKTRNHCLEKINIYIIGLRSGGHKDFTFVPSFEGKAMTAYNEKHKACDTAINTMAQNVYSRVEEDEQ